jgi:hypothetical protein
VKQSWPYFLAGVILGGIGLVWTLQGLNVLGGSVMSGSSFWATVGPIVLVVGLALIAVGIAIVVRRRRAQ